MKICASIVDEPNGFFELETTVLINILENLRRNGEYKSLITTNPKQGIHFWWTTEFLGEELVLSKFDLRHGSVFIDHFCLTAIDWKLKFTYRRGGPFHLQEFDSRVELFNAYGLICDVEVSNLDNFKRDYSFLMLFGNSEIY